MGVLKWNRGYRCGNGRVVRDRPGGQVPQTALVTASPFTAIATVYALVWRLLYRRGPLEMLVEG